MNDFGSIGHATFPGIDMRGMGLGEDFLALYRARGGPAEKLKLRCSFGDPLPLPPPQPPPERVRKPAPRLADMTPEQQARRKASKLAWRERHRDEIKVRNQNAYRERRDAEKTR